MTIGSRCMRYFLLIYALGPMMRLAAQQYCASGTVSESHTNDLKTGDPVILTAQVESGTQSCTTFSDRTECSAVVQLEIQSGSRRWSGAALQSKAASIAFIFYPRDTTTRIVLGGVVAPAQPPQALSPLNVFGVHLDFGTYSGNRLANGGLPPAVPSISDRPFEPPSFTLTGPGGNASINYMGHDCGGAEKCRSLRPSPSLITFLASCEGHAEDYGIYDDSLQNCTLGVGQLLHEGPCTQQDEDKYPDGQLPDVALKVFVQNVNDAAADINRNDKNPDRCLTQNQFDALVSLDFNMGLAVLETHHVWTDFTSGNYNAIPSDILTLGAGGPGMRNRRANEALIFKNTFYNPGGCYEPVQQD